MIKNYLKIALRTLWKEKLFSLISIFGLAVSMTASWMIFRYVKAELSYDRFHTEAENTYRVVLDIYKDSNLEVQSARVAPAVADALQEEFPAVETFTRLVILGPDGVLTYEDRFTGEGNIYLADSAFFQVFSFPLVQGNPQTALNEPFCAVITQSTAQILFADENPLGKSITVDADNFDGQSPTFKVTGVMKDVPNNTHLPTGMLISYPTLFEFVGHQFDNSWEWNNTYTYVRLQEKTDPKILEAAFPSVVHQFNGAALAEVNVDWQYHLQPIFDIHLGSNLQHEASVNGNDFYIYVLAATALLILLIAYINFVNLTIVKALRRAKEVGIRKVSGANRQQLVAQFFLETILVNTLATGLAIFLLRLSEPLLSDIFELNGYYRYTNIAQWWIAPGLWLLLLVLGSGFYPALVLSNYQPARVLKGSFTKGNSGVNLRKVLVTSQFALAFVFITLTVVADRQIRFMQEQDLGFNPSQVIVLKAPKSFDYGYQNNFSQFQQVMNEMPHVQSVSASGLVPGQDIFWYDDRVTVDGQESSGVFSVLHVASDYFSQYGIELLSGRSFNQPARDRWIVNESAMRLLGFQQADEAVGQVIKRNGQPGEIIGVVKDFHHESLKEAIEPNLFFCGSSFNYYTMKVETSDLPKTLEKVASSYQELFPGSPYEYFFLDEFFNRQYQAEQKFNYLFRLFSGLAILIACLGLLALSSYTMVQRTKEIGIRKVLGASISNLVLLLTKDYIRLIAVALLIAIPLANYLATEWLQNFAFPISITLGLFILPALLILGLTFLTVGSQTLRAAQRNPTDSLQEE